MMLGVLVASAARRRQHRAPVGRAGASLGALLRDHGVRLPVTLSLTATDTAATDFVALQRSLAASASSGVARVAIEKFNWQLGNVATRL